MSHFEAITQKLQQFIQKYYLNELLRGAILFLSAGGLYFLFTLLLEYFLWLNPTARTVLFWVFIAAELALLYRFIALPLSRLFRLRKGISPQQAARLIGRHFPQVSDKLLNVLQLAESRERSELLMASIEQKSASIEPVPFRAAINLAKNIAYSKYLLLPFLIVALLWLSGDFKAFSRSYERVINYREAYQPPAPFQFLLMNDSLTGIENKPFTLYLKTKGTLIPEEVQLNVNGQTYFLQNTGPGNFVYTFPGLQETTDFYFTANNIHSPTYHLNVLKVPVLTDFEMRLTYPAYTQKPPETLKSTGNATLPEGTTVTWALKTHETERIGWISNDTTLFFHGTDNDFELSKKIFQPVQYTLSTSNENLKEYEKLSFYIDVIKDAYPQITVTHTPDSLNNQRMDFSGELSDDYGLSKLQLVYYPKTNETGKNIYTFPLKPVQFSRFSYIFPNQLQLEEGVAYEFYFEVFDNDGLRGGKSAKSNVFSYRAATEAEVKQQQLEQQAETIKNLDRTLKNATEQEKNLEEISRSNKEKAQLSYNEKRKLNDFLQRQRQQEQLMQRFTENLQENLENFQEEKEQPDAFKELLQERLERQQQEMERQEKLLEELRSVTDRINQEELAKRLEQLAKQQKNNQRNLEQLLELTKRYYVSAKATQLQQELERLANEQEKFANKSGMENNAEKQREQNEAFKKFQEEMKQLEKENEALKKPMEIGQDEKTSDAIRKEQENALEQLKQQPEPGENPEQSPSQEKAQQHQKNAARNMKRMSEQMQAQMQAGGQAGASEDAQVLRQILDNLLVFSFEQEDLLKRFDKATSSDPNFSKNLRKQRELRELFQHVDDSLFALSLRLPEISETVTQEISNVYFNIDKTLERLAENQVYQAVSSERYALTATNNLADFLSNVLDNMQQQMGSGSGKGNQQQEFQLPDIIQSQEQINQQMQNAMKQQQGGEKQEGEKQGEKDGKNPSGKSQGDSDEENAEQLYKIYQQQQQLRQLLEQQLQDKKGNGTGKDAKELLKEMEQIEKDLLEKGLQERTLQRMVNLQHRLLELDDAAFQQGEKQERESETSRQTYQNPVNKPLPGTNPYFNQTDILNRDALPLQPVYKQKVQEYFKNGTD